MMASSAEFVWCIKHFAGRTLNYDNPTCLPSHSLSPLSLGYYLVQVHNIPKTPMRSYTELEVRSSRQGEDPHIDVTSNSWQTQITTTRHGLGLGSPTWPSPSLGGQAATGWAGLHSQIRVFPFDRLLRFPSWGNESSSLPRFHFHWHGSHRSHEMTGDEIRNPTEWASLPRTRGVSKLASCWILLASASGLWSLELRFVC